MQFGFSYETQWSSRVTRVRSFCLRKNSLGDHSLVIRRCGCSKTKIVYTGASQEGMCRAGGLALHCRLFGQLHRAESGIRRCLSPANTRLRLVASRVEASPLVLAIILFVASRTREDSIGCTKDANRSLFVPACTRRNEAVFLGIYLSLIRLCRLGSYSLLLLLLFGLFASRPESQSTYILASHRS